MGNKKLDRARCETPSILKNSNLLFLCPLPVMANSRFKTFPVLPFLTILSAWSLFCKASICGVNAIYSQFQVNINLQDEGRVRLLPKLRSGNLLYIKPNKNSSFLIMALKNLKLGGLFLGRKFQITYYCFEERPMGASIKDSLPLQYLEFLYTDSKRPSTKELTSNLESTTPKT